MKATKYLLLAFALNFGFAVVEFVCGTLFRSQAVLADAVHDLGDAVAIGCSILLQWLSHKQADHRFSFGYKRLSLLGALITATILISGSLTLIWHNVPQLWNPEPVHYDGMLLLGIVAIVVNAFAASLMRRGSSANERLLTLHFLEDILGWVAVIVAAVLMRWTQWYVLDTVFSLAIALYLLWQAVPQWLETVRLFLESVPAQCNYTQLKTRLAAVPQVTDIAQLTVWSLDGATHLATVHVCVLPNADTLAVKQAMYHVLQDAGIHSATIEFDSNLAEHEAHRQLNQTAHHHHHHP